MNAQTFILIFEFYLDLFDGNWF